MNKKLFLSALFAGSMVVNCWAGFVFDDYDDVEEFIDDNIDNPDIVMEDHLTIDTLKNVNDACHLSYIMLDTREEYEDNEEKYKAKVDKINSIIFNIIVALDPNFGFVDRFDDSLYPYISTFLNNELIIGFFKDPDNLSKIHTHELTRLVNCIHCELEDRLNSYDESSDKKIVEDMRFILETTYDVLTKRMKDNGIVFEDHSLYYLVDCYGERGLDFITEQSVSGLFPIDLIELAAHIEELHLPKADDFIANVLHIKERGLDHFAEKNTSWDYLPDDLFALAAQIKGLHAYDTDNLYDNVKGNLNTIKAGDFLEIICNEYFRMMGGTPEVVRDIIPNYPLRKLTSIVNNLPSGNNDKDMIRIAEIKDIISQQINAKKEELATPTDTITQSRNKVSIQCTGNEGEPKRPRL